MKKFFKTFIVKSFKTTVAGIAIGGPIVFNEAARLYASGQLNKTNLLFGAGSIIIGALSKDADATHVEEGK